jgi:hypothetical protein
MPEGLALVSGLKVGVVCKYMWPLLSASRREELRREAFATPLNKSRMSDPD